MNRDHSVVFEVASKYCISDSFVDYVGYSSILVLPKLRKVFFYGFCPFCHTSSFLSSPRVTVLNCANITPNFSSYGFQVSSSTPLNDIVTYEKSPIGQYFSNYNLCAKHIVTVQVLIGLFLSSFMSCFYILEINLLSIVSFVHYIIFCPKYLHLQIFSPILRAAILFIISFAVQKAFKFN